MPFGSVVLFSRCVLFFGGLRLCFFFSCSFLRFFFVLLPMEARLKVDGKLFEFVCEGERGAFPLRVYEANRKRSYVIRLGVEEFRWLARELAHF